MKHRIRHLKQRYPVAFGVSAGVFLAAGAAAAAFTVYSLTVGGTQGGTFATGTNLGPAITVTSGTPSGALNQGSSVTVPISFGNNDSISHTIQTVTETFTTKNSSNVDDTATCASHLTVTDGTNPVGHALAGGSGFNDTQTISADATTPNSCAGGTWTETFGGTIS